MRALLVFMCFVCFVVPLQAAESPTFIPFQGRITDQGGNTYTNGQYTILFQLYNQAVGGQAIWQERHDKVGVVNGLVNVFLGSINPLTSVDFSSTRHLGITIDADNNPNTPEPEMIPRQMIIPAFWAKNSEKLAGQDWTPIFGTNSPLGALPAAKIQSKGITAGQIAAGTVGTTEIATNGVRTANIADGQITAEKLSSDLTRDSVIPAGTIQAFGGSSIPDGWLLCNGAALSSGQYPRLYSAISTNWGSGFPASTNNFNLPDLRGMFLRGSGTHAIQVKAAGGNFDGGKLGIFDEDKIQGHRHSYYKGDIEAGVVSASVLGSGYGGAPTVYSSGGVRDPSPDLSNGVPRIGNETKPASYSVNYIIKY